MRALLTFSVSDASLSLLRECFSHVTYLPSTVPDRQERIHEELQNAQVFITHAKDLAILDAQKTPGENLKIIQIGSAGMDAALKTGWLKSLIDSGRIAKNGEEWKDCQNSLVAESSILLTNASGVHARSISQYCVATLLTLYHSLDKQIVHARNKREWVTGDAFVGSGEKYCVETVYGKTVGMLGYGHIGRETARLLKAFGATIIAATSTGTQRSDTGYVLPGTGDCDGSIPETYYATTDKAACHDFLERVDVLICSVPSTGRTSGMIGQEQLGCLPKDAVVINVGRGDLIDTDALLESLNAGHLRGAALDVTSPEPLPSGHPLWSHPRCIVTPHLSGDVKEEMDEVVRLCVDGVKRWQAGGMVWNAVDVEKGY
ncbi:hypothetical protein NliqN6_6848 [Naganishia liquefaciens]|uniref:D-isomer specific 2-hydroxyacid dehydrogenase NAD-binding domain-containing protein n=1 Tax=Naganishia liquefaciens TaxID=104408 RepID=A0A8H3YKE2_9TREE|nr:hypothetical protein NliqN6_6848 [Naganishia liquefaciens]